MRSQLPESHHSSTMEDPRGFFFFLKVAIQAPWYNIKKNWKAWVVQDVRDHWGKENCRDTCHVEASLLAALINKHIGNGKSTASLCSTWNHLHGQIFFLTACDCVFSSIYPSFAGPAHTLKAKLILNRIMQPSKILGSDKNYKRRLSFIFRTELGFPWHRERQFPCMAPFLLITLKSIWGGVILCSWHLSWGAALDTGEKKLKGREVHTSKGTRRGYARQMWFWLLWPHLGWTFLQRHI